MFEKTRLKLTGYYLLIIMSVSFLFSLAIYTGINQELVRVERFEEIRRLREEQGFLFPPIQDDFRFNPDLVIQSRQRLILTLLSINLGILAVSGLAGYFLAGKTLEPIALMIDEQNRFVADASHELKTPLTSLKTSTEVSLRDADLTLKEARNLLQDNLGEINELQSLSENLLRLARSDQLNDKKNLDWVDISLVCEEAVRKVNSLAKNKKITIETDVATTMVKGDKSSLVEMLVVLLDNAIKYSSAKTQIKVLADKEGNNLLLSIADRGRGIAKEDLPHIFDRFYRSDKSRSKNEEVGYGLGLSIARKIVQLHRGTIMVESTLGEGSTFKVRLPLS